MRKVLACLLLCVTPVWAAQFNLPGVQPHDASPAVRKLRITGYPNAAPTLDGDTGFDTTKHVPVRGQNGVTVSDCGVLSVQTGGDTNNSSSGSGSYRDYSLTYTIPANFLTLNKFLEVRVGYGFVTGSAAPTIKFKLKVGGSDAYLTGGAITPPNNEPHGAVLYTYQILAKAAPSASAGVDVRFISGFQQAVSDSAEYNTITQPLTLATNGTLAIVASSIWGSAGTGTNTATQDFMIVKVCN